MPSYIANVNNGVIRIPKKIRQEYPGRYYDYDICRESKHYIYIQLFIIDDGGYIIDKQNRIKLSNSVLRQANIKRECYFIEFCERLEIWSPYEMKKHDKLLTSNKIFEEFNI